MLSRDVGRLGRDVRNKPYQVMRAPVGEKQPKFGLQMASTDKLFVRDSSLYSPCHTPRQLASLYTPRAYEGKETIIHF